MSRPLYTQSYRASLKIELLTDIPHTESVAGLFAVVASVAVGTIMITPACSLVEASIQLLSVSAAVSPLLLQSQLALFYTTGVAFVLCWSITAENNNHSA